MTLKTIICSYLNSEHHQMFILCLPCTQIQSCLMTIIIIIIIIADSCKVMINIITYFVVSMVECLETITFAKQLPTSLQLPSYE